jgi:Dna[CI] antecedent DciA-like protein
MQHARATLNKIYSTIVRNEGPLTAWPLACGSRIAARASALTFADGVLTVSVPDEAWRQQLQSFIPQYIAALNQVVAEPVKRIEFRIVQRER